MLAAACPYEVDGGEFEPIRIGDRPAHPCDLRGRSSTACGWAPPAPVDVTYGALLAFDPDGEHVVADDGPWVRSKRDVKNSRSPSLRSRRPSPRGLQTMATATCRAANTRTPAALLEQEWPVTGNRPAAQSGVDAASFRRRGSCLDGSPDKTHQACATNLLTSREPRRLPSVPARACPRQRDQAGAAPVPDRSNVPVLKLAAKTHGHLRFFRRPVERLALGKSSLLKRKSA